RMLNPRAGAHALDFAGTDRRSGAQRILMCQFTFQDVGNDLHIAVRVHVKSRTGNHDVIVDHPQRTKPHSFGIHKMAEGKSMLTVEPSGSGFTANVSVMNANHKYRLPFLYDR